MTRLELAQTELRAARAGSLLAEARREAAERDVLDALEEEATAIAVLTQALTGSAILQASMDRLRDAAIDALGLVHGPLSEPLIPCRGASWSSWARAVAVATSGMEEYARTVRHLDPVAAEWAETRGQAARGALGLLEREVEGALGARAACAARRAV